MPPADPADLVDPALADGALLREILEAAPDAMIVIDGHGRIVFANRQTETLFGHARVDLIGASVELLVPERLRAGHALLRDAFFERPCLRPMGIGLELHGRRCDGVEFPVEIGLSPVAAQGRRLVSASIRDTTDRQRSEREIARTQSHLLSAVGSIQGAFALFDADDRLVVCNDTYQSWFIGDPSRPAVGESFEVVLDAMVTSGRFELARGSRSELRAALLANHRQPAAALDLVTTDGLTLKLFERRTTESGTVVTAWDVTEGVRHEEELLAARGLAEAASSAKSEFLASMSHELRTPLNAILGFAQLLARDRKVPLSERHQERIQHVLKGGEHLLRLIDEILDLSRIESGHIAISLEPVELPSVLEEVKATLDPMAARGEIDLSVTPSEPGLPAVVVDRTRFKQVLMNFASNAIKYGRRGGHATFQVEALGERVRVSVIDDGVGIPEDKHDRIFQPFQRAGQEAGPIEGTGIGLAITRRLAQLMDAEVGFESSEGHGSRFWIAVPVHVGSVAGRSDPALRPAPRPHPAGAKSRTLVVYVEDNPSNIAFMTDFVADFDGIELVTAPTAEIGLEIVRARRPALVLMDVNLPGMNGFEASRRLKEWPETHGIPVVALTAAATARDTQQAHGAGFHRYLTKPVDVDELTRVMNEILG